MKAFTVTVAGTERFDGDAPYTWVLEASDMAGAIQTAVAHHALAVDQRLCDLEVDVPRTFEGLPSADCGYFWNDLRADVQLSALRPAILWGYEGAAALDGDHPALLA